MFERKSRSGGCVLGLLLAALLAAAPPAQAAVLEGDSYTLQPGAVLTVPAPGVLGNDSFREPYTLELVSSTTGGELTLGADGGFTYAHGGGGSDSFTYRVTDQLGPSEPATVSLVVVDPGAPEAVPDTYTVPAGGTLEIPAPGVLGNDQDPDGDPMTAVPESTPLQAAEFSLGADGSLIYVHDGSDGTSDGDGGADDAFTYRASDGTSTSEPATVTIAIDRGIVTPGSVVVGFSEVAAVEVSSYIGDLTGAGGALSHLGLRLVAPGTVPASAVGPGVPSQVSTLELRVDDPTFAAAANAQFADCQRAALVAQVRPALYRLEVSLHLATTDSIVEASPERLLIALPSGMVRCRLERLP